MKKNIFFLALILITCFMVSSCKKKTVAELSTGTASAVLYDNFPKGISWTATSVSAVKSGNNYEIIAQGADNTNYTLKLNNILATGTVFREDFAESFVYNGRFHTTTNIRGTGGGIVVITTLSPTKIEGTFTFEGYEITPGNPPTGGSYVSISQGKFSVSIVQ